MSQNITYDDRDVSVLDYSPNWFLTGTYNATSVDQTGTLSSTDNTNASVTFVFPTPATAFYYFGVKRCCGGSYLICVDCDPNDRQFIPIDAVNRTDDGKNPPVVLFSRQFSTPGVHEVILMNSPDPRFNGNSQITLDRFELTVPESPSAAQSESSALSQSATPNLFSTPTPSTSALPETSSSSPSASSLLAPILGGVLGGLAALLIVLAAWLLLRRRSRRPVYNEEQAPPDNQSQMRSRTDSTWAARSFFNLIEALLISAPDINRSNDDLCQETLPPEYGQVFNAAQPQHEPPLLRLPKARR
ncbi:hypothetical protein B0H10DRAFT_2213581 [Mycena sp. CBHHK59/15]|nr:hypothetical protein B0H10DRAFT_2213581 [Mycena sp. CBHHK59/15]